MDEKIINNNIAFENYSDIILFLKELNIIPVVVEDKYGTYRFKRIPIMRYLCDNINLNKMREAFIDNKFSLKEYVQFYMDIGYSFCGFEEVWGETMDEILEIQRDRQTGEEVLRGTSIKLYSDGACSGNPGPGGWGAVFSKNGQTEKLSEGYKFTTNNRMELLGIIEPLEKLEKSCSVEIYTDSKYVVNAINENWLKNWIKKGWKNSNNKPVLNIDLWKRFLPLLEKHNLQFNWIKGHNSHVENELCDIMAVKESRKRSENIDVGYDKI